MTCILRALPYDQRNVPFIWGYRVPPLLSRLGSPYFPIIFKTVQLWTVANYEGLMIAKFQAHRTKLHAHSASPEIVDCSTKNGADDKTDSVN